MPDLPGLPSAEELSALPAAELAVRLAEAYRLIAELTAQVERLSARAEDLERVAGVLAARSEAELAEVVRSLPAPVALTSPQRQLARPLEIHSGMRRLRLAGKWQVARETHISADLGSIRLDLTEAEFDDHVVDLHIYTGWGSITIIVAPGHGRAGDPPPRRSRLTAGPAGTRAAAGPARRDHQYRQSPPAPPGDPGPHQTLARRQKTPITSRVHRAPQSAMTMQRPHITSRH